MANSGSKAQTQERILAAALELFVSNGYDGTTMRDIADKAGVSRATVFWHFSEKASVFRETFNRMLAPLRESLDRSWEDVDLEKRLDMQISISEQFVLEHGKEIFTVVRWALESPQLREMVLDTLLDLNQRFSGVLAETLARLFPNDRDPRPSALALMLAFDAALILSIYDPRPETNQQRAVAVRALVDMINRDARNSAANPGDP